MSTQKDLSEVKALTFDVFGTVVDWRSSIIRELKAFGSSNGFVTNWEGFADKWREGYAPSMDMVRKGELPWTNIDELHHIVLDCLLDEYNITGLNEDEKEHLNTAWHRLTPWPDSLKGLERMRTRYTVATLSNANVSLLINLAKYGGLTWDCVLSAELFGHYKPDKEVYISAATLLGLSPGQVMMVASHTDDLQAAQKLGFGTAYVPRPLEFGPNDINIDKHGMDETKDMAFDIIARDFNDLARQLGT